MTDPVQTALENALKSVGPRGTEIAVNARWARRAVANWLIAKGLPESAANSLRPSTLTKAWASDAYANAVLRNWERLGKRAGSNNNAPAPVTIVQQAPAPEVSPEMVQQAVEKFFAENPRKPLHVIVESRIAPNKVVTISAAHPILARVARKIAARQHVYLPGPAGCGKTHLGKQAAQLAGLKFYSTGAVDSQYALLGFRDANGVYRGTPFRQAYEFGGVFLFDEMDASDSAALLCVNQALANDEMAFPDGMVTRHPDFVCIAAANTFGHGADRMYVGRSQLDAATLDRFARIAMDYDEELEERLAIAAVPAANAEQARGWVARVRAIRAEARLANMRVCVSMRAAIEGARDLAAGDTLQEVEESRILAGHDSAVQARLRAAGDRVTTVAVA